MTRLYSRGPAIDRFATKYVINDRGCWLWIGALNPAGYGTFNPRPGHKVYAHRYIYDLLVEPLIPGLEIDHLCSVRHCVNPDHLEQVTHEVNISRNSKSTATHCVNGHEFTVENTYRRKDTGTRKCRTCAAQRERQRSQDPRHGCPGDPAATANKATTQFAGLV